MCPGPEAPKKAQIITPPTPCLAVGMRCLCRYDVVVDFGSSLWSNIFTLGPVCLKNIVLYVLWFVQTCLCKPKSCCHVLF